MASFFGEWKPVLLKGEREDKLEKALSLWLAFAIWGNSEALEHLDKELWQEADHFEINNIPKSADHLEGHTRHQCRAPRDAPPSPEVRPSETRRNVMSSSFFL